MYLVFTISFVENRWAALASGSFAYTKRSRSGAWRARERRGVGWGVQLGAKATNHFKPGTPDCCQGGPGPIHAHPGSSAVTTFSANCNSLELQGKLRSESSPLSGRNHWCFRFSAHLLFAFLPVEAVTREGLTPSWASPTRRKSSRSNHLHRQQAFREVQG